MVGVIVQSSLSRKIAQLEHELGHALFERHSRGMRPTEAGDLLVEAARQIVARMERLASDIEDLGETGRGAARVFASQALVEHVLMPRVLELWAQHPNARIDLTIAAGRQAERALIDDDADFALIVTVPRHPDIEILAERSNRVVALVSSAHPLARRREISVEDVAAGPFAALPPTYSSRRVFDAMLPHALRAATPEMTANSITALKLYAASGRGVAVTPELVVRGDGRDEGLAVVALANADATDTRMCLCKRRSRSLGATARRLLASLAASFADPEDAARADAGHEDGALRYPHS